MSDERPDGLPSEFCRDWQKMIHVFSEVCGLSHSEIYENTNVGRWRRALEEVAALSRLRDPARIASVIRERLPELFVKATGRWGPSVPATESLARNLAEAIVKAEEP